MILLIGSIYAVMYAFVIFVVWGQFTDVENFTMRECNSLDDLLRFSRHLSDDAARSVRRAVRDYAHWVVESEWKLLGQRQRDGETEHRFTALMTTVIELPAATPAQEAMRERLIEIVRRAGEHRDERITKSLTRIPPTLVHLTNTMALALLLLVFVYPFHHMVAGAAFVALLALVLFLANMVLRDTDNPFEGICNVSTEPFANLEDAR